MGVNQCGTGCTVCVFDSGIGGLNLLHACAVRCPGADFLYFADNFNMPYGELPAEKVRRFVFDAFKKIASFSPAAAVVACNTATALCIADLRAQYPFPVIGIQPAVKQAVERRGGCLVLATPATSASPSFARLCADYGEGRAQVLPCPGLAEYIERGIGAFPSFDGISRILPRPDSSPSCVVLGCTHYVFARDAIARHYGCDTFDGILGTADHLADILGKKLNNSLINQNIEFIGGDHVKNEQIYRKIFGNYRNNADV